MSLLNYLKKHVDYDIAVMNACKSEREQLVYLIEIIALKLAERTSFTAMVFKFIDYLMAMQIGPAWLFTLF